MSGPRVVSSKCLENKLRDSKTPASIPISGRRDLPRENQEASLNAEPFEVAKSRYYGHFRGNEGIYLFYCSQHERRVVRVRVHRWRHYYLVKAVRDSIVPCL